MKVFFIIVDAMRRDYMSSNGYPRPTTPNLDRIAEGSIVFDRAYASINQTDMSLTSIFSGNYPPTHGLELPAAFMSPEELASLPAWDTRYLAQILNESQYHTIGFDWLDRWHQWGYDWYWIRDARRGVWFLRRLAARFPQAAQAGLRFVKRLKGNAGESFAKLVSKPGFGAAKATDSALRFVNKHLDDDAFVMLHYWDVHTPYNFDQMNHLDTMRAITLAGEERDVRNVVDHLCKSDEYKDWFSMHVVKNASTVGDVVTQYCASLRTVDEQIGRLYRFVERNNLLDESIFVITADHGENLFEHGYFVEHSGVYENVVHVPLVLHLPGLGASRIDEVVSHVDIVPTLVDYLGLREDAPFDGATLIPLIADGRTPVRDHVYFQSRSTESNPSRGIVGPRYKYVENREKEVLPCEFCGEYHIVPVELYDLVADPRETTNLADTHPEICRRLASELRGTVAQLRDRNTRPPAATTAPRDSVYSEGERREMEERLRSLGYLD